MNYHDGEDYFRYSLKFKEIIDEGRKILSQFEDGDRIVLVNRLSENLTLESAGEVRGSLSILYIVAKGLEGL